MHPGSLDLGFLSLSNAISTCSSSKAISTCCTVRTVALVMQGFSFCPGVATVQYSAIQYRSPSDTTQRGRVRRREPHPPQNCTLSFRKRMISCCGSRTAQGTAAQQTAARKTTAQGAQGLLPSEGARGGLWDYQYSTECAVSKTYS